MTMFALFNRRHESVGRCVGKGGLHPDDITKLKQSEDLGNIRPCSTARHGIVTNVAVPVILRRLLGTVEVPAIATQFVASDHFKGGHERHRGGEGLLPGGTSRRG